MVLIYCNHITTFYKQLVFNTSDDYNTYFSVRSRSICNAFENFCSRSCQNHYFLLYTFLNAVHIHDIYIYISKCSDDFKSIFKADSNKTG